MSLLERTISAIGPADMAAAESARRRLDRLTKPPGSLGLLEAIAVRVAAASGRARPTVRRKVIYTLAADHGVAAEGVSAYPREVTAQMVLNFLRGGAAVNVLARAAGADVVVADFGVAAELSVPCLLNRRIGPGTANLARGPAMTRDQARAAVEAGIGLVGEADLIGTGDMGIGNSTAAAAVTAAITGRAPAQVAGRGTGIDDDALLRKIAVLEGAPRTDPHDGLDVLSKVGGFEIGGLAGVLLGAAARRIPVLLDGYISGAAALIADVLCPSVRSYLLAAHRSAEPGHAVVLGHLGLRPILELEMRLGEGTGAALAMPLVAAACRILDEMATFEEAGVSDRS